MTATPRQRHLHGFFLARRGVFTVWTRRCEVSTDILGTGRSVRGMGWSMAPVEGDLAALQAVLQGPADDWSPGEVVMHSPRHVRTVVRVWRFPVDLELLLDGPDVRPMTDRRQLVVLPRQHWLPELDGVLHFVDSATGTRRWLLAYDWSVQRDGSLPRRMVPSVAGAIADAIIRPAARTIERLARRPR